MEFVIETEAIWWVVNAEHQKMRTHKRAFDVRRKKKMCISNDSIFFDAFAENLFPIQVKQIFASDGGMKMFV